jgi:hypothetical protein
MDELISHNRWPCVFFFVIALAITIGTGWNRMMSDAESAPVDTVMKVAEVLILLAMAILSTKSYFDIFRTLDALRPALQVEDNPANVFMFLNWVSFLSAFVVLFLLPEPLQLFPIFAIFATFSFSNIVQSRAICKHLQSQAAVPRDHGALLFLTTKWLHENGPTMVGYAVLILVAVVSYTLFPVLATSHTVAGFVGGAAVFHISVSIIVFFLSLRDDPLVRVHKSIKWYVRVANKRQKNQELIDSVQDDLRVWSTAFRWSLRACLGALAWIVAWTMINRGWPIIRRVIGC